MHPILEILIKTETEDTADELELFTSELLFGFGLKEKCVGKMHGVYHYISRVKAITFSVG